MEEITNYTLDACALIAYLQEEEGAEKVKTILKNPSNLILMHAINFGEVYYDALKVSKNKANHLFMIIEKLPIKIIWNIDKQLIEHAGSFKVDFKMSYADSFVLSTAKINNAHVVSSDHHEFDTVEQNTNLRFHWIR
ncbi:MAG: type II toxin-antitoxin system VapC family toxin [Bacteroidetes bacterium]|nr:MAG: type II toxin-antitoxin system VapC family toxin [Bacteroidota bacterium]